MEHQIRLTMTDETDIGSIQ